MSGAPTMNRLDPLCCSQPWLVESPWDKVGWYCQSCGQILTVPKRANRTNDRERPKVVEEGKATTIDSFEP